jgi:hypothetical protein
MPASRAAAYFAIASTVVPVMLLLLLGIQALNPRSDPKWTFPAWDDNVLNFGQPLRFFHFIGTLMAATAVGASLSIMLGRTTDYWPIGGAGGLAMGLWLGVRLCWRMFSHKRSGPTGEESRRRRTRS